MKQRSRFSPTIRTLLLLLPVVSFSPQSFAKEKDDPASLPTKDSYLYPELLVVPKATQALASEVASEKQNAYTSHLLLQAPALLTLMAGLSSSGLKDPSSKDASLIATSVGTGWLAATVGLSMVYSPYRTANAAVNAMPSKSPEQILARERKAEEGLFMPAYIMRRVQYISAISNLASSAAVASAKDASSQTKALGGIAAMAALLPLIFDHPWISSYDQQQDYKKKIYGPLSQVSFEPNVQTGQLDAAVNLSMRF